MAEGTFSKLKKKKEKKKRKKEKKKNPVLRQIIPPIPFLYQFIYLFN